MSAAGPLIHITDQNLSAVLGTEMAILVLAKNDCGSCASYQAEIEALIEGGKLTEIAIGKLILNQPGASRFKRTNPWLADVKQLPYTVLYRNGKRVDEFAASKGSYLLERVEDMLEPNPNSIRSQ